MGADGTEDDDSIAGLARELARAPAAELAPALERYRLGDLLGRGGCGQVYRAFDLRLRRDVALKFLVSADADQLHRLVGEAQAQARVDHPHICKVYEIVDEGDRPFISMQLILGETLAAAAPRLDARAKVSIMADVAEAMEAAHRLRIVHRDLKPANIMLEPTPAGDLHAYVMDFGLAREVGATVSHGVVGTPAYMAPEQARGDTAAIGPPSDVYGLGATLFAVLAGEPPFKDATVVQVLAAVVGRDPPPLRARVPDLARDLEIIVATCLAKDPARRYPSAGALAGDLRRFLAETPIQARAPSLSYRLRRGVSRRLPLVVTSAALAVAAAALALFIARPRSPWTPRSVPLGPVFEEWSGAISVAPDGREIVYASQRDGGWRLYAEELSASGETGPSRPLTPPALSAFGPHYGRDGTAIFFVAERPGGGDVYRLPRGGGSPTLLTTGFTELDDCGGGRLILRAPTTPGCDDCERLVLREPDGRERELLRTTRVELLHSASCDRAGRLVAYGRETMIDDRHLEVLDLATGGITVLTGPLPDLSTPIFHPDGRSVLFGQRGRLYEVTLDRRVLPITQGTIDAWPAPAADGRLLAYDEVVEDTAVFALRAGQPRRRLSAVRVMTYALVLTPDGAALVLAWEVEGADTIGTLSLVDGVLRTLAPGRSPRLSLDGREIFFLRGQGPATELWSIARAGGEPLLRARVPDALRVYPGRGEVHVQRMRNQGYEAWRVPLDGSPPTLEAAPPVAAIWPSPDGAWVLVRRIAGGDLFDLVLPAGAPLDDPRALRVSWARSRWGANGSLHGLDHGKIMALVPATGLVREVMPMDYVEGSEPVSWAVSLDEKTVYRSMPTSQQRRMLITNFGDRPRP